MAGKTLQELIKRQDEARLQAKNALSTVSTGKTIDPKEAARELDRMIAEQGARVEVTRAAQVASNLRFETEIKAREQRIAELTELSEQYKRGTSKPTHPNRPTRPAGRGRLQDVNGIGAVAEKRLEEGGIDTLDALSKAPPAKVAELLGVQEERAAVFVAEARRLSRR
jgi:predicted flap endonuclease-1-like 5' DNA nuclease